MSTTGDLQLAREALQRVLDLADEMEERGEIALAIPELNLVGNAYKGCAQRMRRAVRGAH